MSRRIILALAVLALTVWGVVGFSLAASGRDQTPVPRHLTGHVHPTQTNHVHKLPKGLDGCDRNYGEPHQCVPADLPRGEEGCAYLEEHHFHNLKVVGEDEKKLDPDSDGIACNH